MGKKYLDTKEGSLEQSILGLWQEAAGVKKEKLDPVGKEDGDIDNDGDKDSTDKYLAKRRKAISKAIKKEKKEEVKLDEKNRITSKEIDFDLFSDESGAKAANKTMNKEIRKASEMKDYKTARKHMDKIQKKYSKLGAQDTEPESIITSILGQVFKEEVELDEKVEYVEYKFKNKNDAMKAKAYFDAIQLMSFDVNDDGASQGELAVDAGNRDMTKYHKEVMKKFKPKVMKQEEVQVKEGKMSQLHQLMKDGKTAEEIAKIMRVDAKTIKKLMAGHMKETYEWGTDELRKHTEDITPGQDGEWVNAQKSKNDSMREALAKVWQTDEGKNPFKKESKKDLTKEVKDGKTMTGKKVASVDINPTIKEKKK